jgi:hypothetical protein
VRSETAELEFADEADLYWQRFVRLGSKPTAGCKLTRPALSEGKDSLPFSVSLRAKCLPEDVVFDACPGMRWRHGIHQLSRSTAGAVSG